jgi:hypothetical protein
MSSYTRPLHNHPIDDCARVGFYYADCKLDDQLTWKEYADLRFRKKSCDTATVSTVRQKFELQPELFTNPNMTVINKLLSNQTKELQEIENQLKQKYGILSSKQ